MSFNSATYHGHVTSLTNPESESGQFAIQDCPTLSVIFVCWKSSRVRASLVTRPVQLFIWTSSNILKHSSSLLSHGKVHNCTISKFQFISLYCNKIHSACCNFLAHRRHFRQKIATLKMYFLSTASYNVTGMPYESHLISRKILAEITTTDRWAR